MNKITLESRKVTLAWDERGTGTPIVLIHAFPLDRRMWLRQITELSDRYRVITPDLPGFGESGPAPAEFSLDQAADIFSEFLTAIGVEEKVVFGGASMGGYIAMAFARNHSPRLKGLILANTKAEADDDAAKANREKQIQLTNDKGPHALIESMLAKMLSETTRTAHPDLAEAVRALGASQPSLGIVAGIQALRDRPDANAGLLNVTVPTLVIVGEDDSITPPEKGRNIAAKIPGATLETIPRVAHLSNMENPIAFNHAVREFVEKLK
jgi:3-oxoadipate enol-lactonase